MADDFQTLLVAGYRFGDMQADYLQDTRTGAVGLRLVPTALASFPMEKDCRVEPLIQAKLLRDPAAPGFSAGRTMRGSASVRRLIYQSQSADESKEALAIHTLFADPETGLRYTHTLRWKKSAPYLSSQVCVENAGTEPQMLEMLASFNLGGLTPFCRDEAVERLVLHRIRSSWAAEARAVAEPIEALHLERSWNSGSMVFERWGQVGSMPVRSWYPQVLLEDTAAGVFWGARLTHAGSWQLEAGRRDNGFALTGGLADREFGHWMKRIAPGTSFAVPEAILTVCTGGEDEACRRLTAWSEDHLDVPDSEASLPVLFNEFCTTWGTPQEDRIAAIAEKLRGLGLRYFVIDAGWYAQKPGDWSAGAGSWEVSPFLFTRGLDDTLNAIRRFGMEPGIWFEFEVAGAHDPHYRRTEWLLHRDGIPVSSGERRFLDFTNPEVLAYLEKRIIGFLREHGIRYVKIDYNDTIGLGTDHPDSPGEGLRQHLEAVQAFYCHLRQELPDLVIEICSSGGHRQVPSFLSLGSMVSFSDAHECDEIPLIAADLHRLIPPRQSQIWAVLHASFGEAQLYNRLNAGLLGRLCLSGDVESLERWQWEIVSRCVLFYTLSAPVIRSGVSRRYGTEIRSRRHARGWQAVVREGDGLVLCVVHTFHDAPETLHFPIPAGLRVQETCMRQGLTCAAAGETLAITGLRDFDGIGILLVPADPH